MLLRQNQSVDKQIEQLNQILNENIEEKDNVIQKREDHVKDKLVNLVDKDARHGAKSDEKTFTDYGSAENRYQMSLRGITIVAPLKVDFNPTGLLPQEKFVFGFCLADLIFFDAVTQDLRISFVFMTVLRLKESSIRC